MTALMYPFNKDAPHDLSKPGAINKYLVGDRKKVEEEIEKEEGKTSEPPSEWTADRIESRIK